MLEFPQMGVRSKLFLPLVFTSHCGIPALTLWLATATPFSTLTCAPSTFSLSSSTRCISGSSRFSCTPYCGTSLSAMCGARLKAWVCKRVRCKREACDWTTRKRRPRTRGPSTRCQTSPSRTLSRELDHKDPGVKQRCSSWRPT